MSEPDPMDVPKVLECLNEALELQQRSVLQLTLASASMFGLDMQSLTGKLPGIAELGLGELPPRGPGAP